MDKRAELLRVAEAPATLRFFDEFVRYETAVGGPDPHMATTAAMSQDCSREELLWRAGCYLGVYNVPTAEQLWRAFPWPVTQPQLIEPWLREHWAGIVTRRERRSVRRPEQLARYLTEYREFVVNIGGLSWFIGGGAGAYEAAWTDVMRVYTLGRYVAIKLLEFYRRYAALGWLEMPDLRLKGGWSPRQGLVLLRPSEIDLLLSDESPAQNARVEEIAEEERQIFGERTGILLDRFRWQVLLCDAKQALVGKRQFPGRSLDSEIMYATKIAPYWGADSDMWAARAKLFPPSSLGEISGWDGVRDELAKVLSNHGYTWTDTRYDYGASKAQLSQPVSW